MLKLVTISTPQHRDIFTQENQESFHTSWIVSDLKSKFELQKQFLDTYGWHSDMSVLRASELWRKILRTSRPDYKIVSKEFLKIFLKRHFSDVLAKQLELSETSFETCFAYAQSLISICVHPDAIPLMREWFLKNEKAWNNWGHWFEAGLALVQHSLSRGLILAPWAAALLEHEAEFEKFWSRPLVFDLGAEISIAEARLIQKLSKNVDVTVLVPNAVFAAKYRHLLQGYLELSGENEISKIKSHRAVSVVEQTSSGSIQAIRFSSNLAEVKHVVAEIRRLIDLGHSANEIAVIAPDIEIYWPVLRRLAEIEGLAIAKDVVIKFQDWPVVSKWLARLRVCISQIESADIEVGVFTLAEKSLINVDEFRKLYSAIYEDEDLSRSDVVSEMFNRKILSQSMSFADFEQLAISQLQLSSFDEDKISIGEKNLEDIFAQLFKEMMRDASRFLRLSAQDWLEYLQNLCAVREIKVQEQNELGFVATNLMAADSSQYRYRYFLGLTDEQLRPTSKSMIDADESFSLLTDLGFAIENPDESFREFELEWLRLRDQNDVVIFPQMDFSGQLQTPNLFWLRFAGSDYHKISVPGITRFDELQTSFSGEWREISMPIDHFKMRLSASAIESYLSCPFKVTAEKIFRLRDPEVVDLDLDARSRGSIYHRLFEKVLPVAREKNFNLGSEYLSELIRATFVELKVTFADARFLDREVNKYLQLLNRFLQAESEWYKMFQSEVIPGEVQFKFTFEGEEFSGKIDRVERGAESYNQNRYVIVDYKSSSASFHAAKSWLDHHELQLLFYCWVVDRGYVEFKGHVNNTEKSPNKLEVAGAFYYSIKNMSRKKGLDLEGMSEGLYEPGRSPLTYDWLESEYQKLEALLKQVILGVKSGAWSANPSDKTECQNCHWSTVCRAPHLM